MDTGLNKGIRFSLAGSCFYMGFLVVTTGPAMTGLLVLLGATDFTFSIIMALLAIANGLQIFLPYFFESISNKVIVLLFSTAQRIIWIGIAILPILIFREGSHFALWLIVGMIALSSAFGAVYQMSYFSWIGEFIPGSQRGRYYSTRIAACAFVGVAVSVLSGWFLTRLNNLTGFALLFCGAVLVGVVEPVLFNRIPNLSAPKPNPKERYFFKYITQPLTNVRFRKLVAAIGCFSYGLNIHAPFIMLYMLTVVGLNYLQISFFFTAASLLSSVALVRRLGTWADRFCFKPILIASCCVMAISAIIWPLTASSGILLILIIGLMRGIGEAGYELASVNLSIGLSPEKSRSIYIAIFMLCTQILAAVLGRITFGLLMRFSFTLVFIISGLVMFISILLVLKIKGEPYRGETEIQC